MAAQILKRKFLNYLVEFFHDSRAIGIMLAVCAAVSLIVANTFLGEHVLYALHAESTFLHDVKLPASALHFINDGLMAVFFFLVGMEIKRELKYGELSSVKMAVLPIVAAIGGMVVPAIIFALFNKGTVFQNGWGIPTATDIAFSLGVASLIGKRFPINLKIFLTAVAIIDDLGAIFIIAFFYGEQVAVWYLLGAVVIVLLLVWLNVKGVAFGWLQVVLGILLWYLVFNSGLHATIGGVIFAFLVPSQLLASLEQKFHRVVNFFILPVFAFANTAIVINSGLIVEMNSTLAWGIMAGLVLGKPLGIFIACKLMVQQGWAALPRGVSWPQMAGAGILAGIGFTMSIFIASLAFGKSNNTDISKITILVSALVSVMAGLAWFRFISKGNSVG